MRALDAARVPPSTAASEAGGAPKSTRRALISLGAASEHSNREARTQIRFRRATHHEKPSPLSLLLSKLFPKTPPQHPVNSARTPAPPQKSKLRTLCEKLAPVLEKLALAVGKVPDPVLVFLLLATFVMALERLRPHWLRPIPVKILVTLSFLPVLVLAAVWRKTELFTKLREGANPLSHPAEHLLDPVEAHLKQREESVRREEEQLKKNYAQLDALRKELAQDPHARDPDAVIVPSRKAAAMIAAGALGAGYDAEAAQAVEQRRREESVKRSREEWRARTEQAEDNVEQTHESLKLMADHAATEYRTRTKELKTKSATSGPIKGTERLMKRVTSMSREEGGEDSEVNRLSRQSEQSGAGSTATSTASKKRRSLFRRRRRQASSVEETNGEARRFDTAGLESTG
eukprot:GFKZ01007463.1.p1 GENE.GFKZ01007463.1~~GFKZ01007463.1.p1  ORF type:complete len:422 (-),score=74.41 GFKZ01007463.1:164-1375(-)